MKLQTCPLCNKNMMRNGNGVDFIYTCPTLHYRAYYWLPVLHQKSILQIFSISAEYAIHIHTDPDSLETRCSLALHKPVPSRPLNIDKSAQYEQLVKLPTEWAKLNFNNTRSIIRKIKSLLLFI